MKAQNTSSRNTSSRPPVTDKVTAQGNLSKSTLVKARQGDLTALQNLMAAPLKPKNIQLRVKRRGPSLAVSFMGRKLPSKTVGLSYVTKGLRKLDIDGIETVQVSGYQLGKFNPRWSETVQLHRQNAATTETPPQTAISSSQTAASSTQAAAAAARTDSARDANTVAGQAASPTNSQTVPPTEASPPSEHAAYPESPLPPSNQPEGLSCKLKPFRKSSTPSTPMGLWPDEEQLNEGQLNHESPTHHPPRKKQARRGKSRREQSRREQIELSPSDYQARSVRTATRLNQRKTFRNRTAWSLGIGLTVLSLLSIIIFGLLGRLASQQPLPSFQDSMANQGSEQGANQEEAQ